MSERREINIGYQVHQDRSKLDPEDLVLLKAAEKAGKMAYAPYSGFYVGAALLMENGTIVIGNNQENASFPAGICAERVAIFAAAANNPGMVVRSLAVIATTKGADLSEPVPPCGICRQVVAEYEAEQEGPIRILLCTANGPIHIFESMKDLLPFHFHEKTLKRH